MRWLAALAVGCAVAAAAPRGATAQPEGGDDAAANAAPAAENAPPAAARPAKRPVPDLDHRLDPPPTPGERLLVVPRALLMPLHVLFEYVLRRPLGLALTESERLGLGAIFDFLLFDEKRGGIVPTAFVDFDFQPSGGFYLFHDALGSPRHHFQAWASTGGSRWFRGTVTSRLALPHRRRLELSFDAWRRPDQLYYGLGPTTPTSNRSRYERTFVHGHVSIRQSLSRRSLVEWTIDVGRERFADTRFGDEPSVPESAQAGRFPLPPGFEDGYTRVGHALHLTFDDRQPWPARGDGALLDAYLAQRLDAERPDTAWVDLRGTVAGFHDLGGRHVLAAALHAQVVQRTGRGEVPFTERAWLGLRPVLLGGFLPGRLVGDTAVVAAVQYEYPVWALADAALHVSIGNVFGEWFAGFAPADLRVSFGLGLKTNRSPDQAFTFQLAFGSEPIGQGVGVESVRLYLGVTPL